MSTQSEVLAKVRKLLDKADSTTFEAEADAFRAKADALMTQYAIDSWQVDQAREENRREEAPTMESFFVCYADNPIKDYIMQLVWAVAQHCRCRAVIFGNHYKGHSEVTAKVVGFPADVQYTEWLFTSLWAQMQNDLEPRPNPDVSFEENVVTLLEAGLPRIRIAEMMDLPRHPTISRMSKIYKAWCEENGKPYSGRNTRPLPITYARNFAKAFVERIGFRLALIKRQSEAAVGGSAIVLFDKSKLVADKMHELFPKTTQHRIEAKHRFNEHARRRGDESAKRADIGQPRIGGNKKEIGDGHQR